MTDKIFKKKNSTKNRNLKIILERIIKIDGETHVRRAGMRGTMASLLGDSKPKKQSFRIQGLELFERLAVRKRWSVNDLVSYIIEVFSYLFDTDFQNLIYEPREFRELKQFAEEMDIHEGTVIREAVDIFSRLISDEVIQRIEDFFGANLGKRSVEEIILIAFKNTKFEIQDDTVLISSKKIAKVSIKKNDMMESKTLIGKKTIRHEKSVGQVSSSKFQKCKSKKHSFKIRGEPYERLSKKKRWSLNDQISYVMELYTYLIDMNKDESNVYESRSFRNLKQYAIEENLHEGEVLRKSINLYSGLLSNGTIQQIKELPQVKNEKRSIEGVLSEIIENLFFGSDKMHPSQN